MDNTSSIIYIAYTGPATIGGRLELNQMGQFYSNLYRYIKESAKTLGLKESQVSIQQEEVKEGSWEVVINITLQQAQDTLAFLGGEKTTGLVLLMEVTGLGKKVRKSSLDLLSFILKLNKRELKLERKDKRTYRLTYKDFENIEVPEEVIDLVKNKKVLMPLQKILEITKEEGIDSFQIRDSKRVVKQEITKNELNLFNFEDNLPEVKFETVKTKVKPKHIVTEGRGQWSFTYEDKPINANINDFEWLLHYQSGKISLPATIMLEVDLQIETHFTGNKSDKPVKKYNILKVHRTITEASQSDMSFNLESTSRNNSIEQTYSSPLQ